MAKARKDNRGRALRKGESQRKDLKYVYTYTDPFHKRKFVYANTLQELREKEADLIKNQLDGLDVYVAGEVPEELTVAEGSACIVIETEWEDGSVTREMCNPEPETSVIETYVKVSEITVGKKSTVVNWK